MSLGDQASDEAIREFVRGVLRDIPPAEYEDFEAEWIVDRGQWPNDTERLRAIFDEEAAQWRARPGYTSEVQQWTARQQTQHPSPAAGGERNPLRIAAQTLIGGVVLFSAFSALVGSIDTAALILLFVVACTAGVSLVILLPTSWVIGWLVWEAFGGIRSLSQGAQAQGSA